MSNPDINIKQLIDSGSSHTSVKDLLAQGFENVRVVEESKIEELISIALDNVVKGKVQNYTQKKLTEQHDHFQKQIKKEFSRLLEKHQAALKLKDEVAKSRDKFKNEVERLRQEMAEQMDQMCKVSADSEQVKKVSGIEQDRLSNIEDVMAKLLENLDQAEQGRLEAHDLASSLGSRVSNLEDELKNKEELLEKLVDENNAVNLLLDESITSETDGGSFETCQKLTDKILNLIQTINTSNKKEQSSEEFENQVKEYRNTIRKLEERIDTLSSSIENKERVVREKDLLIDQLEVRCSESEKGIRESRATKESEIEILLTTNQTQREKDERDLECVNKEIFELEDILTQRGHQIQYYYNEKESFKQRLDELEKQIQLGTFQPSGEDTRAEAIQQIIEQEKHIQSEINRLWKEYQGKEEAIKPLVQKKNDAEGRRARIIDPEDPKIQQLRESILNLSAAIQGLEDGREKVNRLIKNSRIRLGELRQERETLQIELKRNCQYMFDELRHQQTDREHKIVEIETQKLRLDRELKAKHGRKKSLEGKYAYEKKRESELRNEINELNRNLEALLSEKEVLLEQKKSLKNEIKDLHQKKLKVKDELQGTTKFLNSQESSVSMALGLEEAATLMNQLQSQNQKLEKTVKVQRKDIQKLQEKRDVPAPASPQPQENAQTVREIQTAQAAQPIHQAPLPLYPTAANMTQIIGPHEMNSLVPMIPMPAPPAPPQVQTHIIQSTPLPRKKDNQNNTENTALVKKLEIMGDHIQLLEKKLESIQTGIPVEQIPNEQPNPDLVIVMEPRLSKPKTHS